MKFSKNEIEEGKCVITKKVIGYDSQKKYIQNLMNGRGCSDNYDIIFTPLWEFENRTSEGTGTGVEWVSVENIKDAYNKSISEGKDYFVLMVSLEKEPTSKRVPDQTMDVVKFIAAENTLEMVICTDGIYDEGGASQRSDVDFYYIFSHNKKVKSIRFAYVSLYYENELIDKVAIKNWGEVRDVCSETILGYGRVTDVKYSDLKESDMILNHHFHYIQEQELQNVPEDSTCVSLKEIFHVSNRKFGSIKIDDSNKYASKSCFSEKIGEVLSFTPFDVKVLEESEVIKLENLYAYQIPANSVVLNSYGSRCSFLWNSADVPMALVGALKKGCRVITYTSDIVDGAYMTQLIMEATLSYKITALSMLTRVLLGWEDCMTLSEVLNLKIVVPSITDQKAKIQVALEDYKKKVLQEQEAERERLGLRTVQQDFEHMLGTPLEFQDSIIEEIRCEMINANIQDTYLGSLIKYMIYNSEFVMRLINTVGKDFSKESMTSDIIDVRELIQGYCDARSIFYSACFDMQCHVKGNETEVFPIEGDRTFLLVMLDAIVENAYRHGFKKKYQQNSNIHQQVDFAIEECNYRGAASIKVLIRNNGCPIEKEFTFDDFVTRGRKGKDGHSGLGGNHIYEIVKRHNGQLKVYSDANWSMILEILIPKYTKNGEN